MLASGIRRIAQAASAASLIAALAACGSAPVGPGYYRVERGDTVYKIARSNHQSVQNIVRWNNLSNPDAIEVDQVLRVEPPAGSAAMRTAPRSEASAATPRANAADSATTAAPANAPSISLVWPTSGKVVRSFDGRNSKGIDIVNAAGTPIVAAAPGTVVYAGNGLRGYGNLLIIKHSGEYLTAYAHNQTLFVKEGQTVEQGQKIADMGDSDNDRVMLHFELRYQGRSIDPTRELPAR
ncbi:peptidoglycan DD-metalloendopeptidase family protein [Paraburkholderia sp. J41]|uniref:peptidoglycan DD-metalloendopeptidase family protein n=1 Tax=Paraburkholderia sp. J41 TaxID=2805433 RepID=UPI002AC3661E|nr:peptidoglycan DD-metalloendopeptidase family protein [Paraburkholderia sp. J41]